MRLELTPEEEQLTSYLDADDATLGRACRVATLALLSDEQDPKGTTRVLAFAASMLLMRVAVEVNSTSTRYNVGGFSIARVEQGDWEVHIHRLSPLDKALAVVRNGFSRAWCWLRLRTDGALTYAEGSVGPIRGGRLVTPRVYPH